MLAERDIKVVQRLRSAGAKGDKGCAVVQWSNGNEIRLALDLGCAEAHATCHLFYATDFADKRALEGVHIRVELRKGGYV